MSKSLLALRRTGRLDRRFFWPASPISLGAEIFPHSHPGTTILAVELGTFGWTLVAGIAHVVRGSAAGATGPIKDISESSTEVILEIGDAIYYEDAVIHTARGAGDQAAVILATQVLTTGEPQLMPVDMEMGTPAA